MPGELAYEVNSDRVADQVFYAIACDPRRSVAVEACAGAGKTWILVSRILRALLEGAAPHEILAITFTKKAAGEMRARLYEWLQAFAHADDTKLRSELQTRGLAPDAAQALVEPLRDLYRSLLASGRPVQIRTFHSWFAALVRSAPLLTLERLGLPARHELLEDDKEAVALVWRRFHEAVLNDPQALADYRDCIAAHGRSQTLKALSAALDKRVEFELADARGVVQGSVQSWSEVFVQWAHVERPCDLLTRPGDVHACLAEAAACLGRASQPSFSALGAQLEQALADGEWSKAMGALLTKDGSPRKFSDTVPGLAQIRHAQELALRLCAASEQEAAWHHHERMVRLTRVLIAHYAQLKRDEGWVDMSDLERAALVMLSDPVLSGWVQQRLDARIRHLLIDEFQDTNPLQWQALHAWLSGYAGAGAGQAPAVFIVGDPKQSIYRFRRAEPQVFRAAQRFVFEALGGDLLACDHTRRNAPAVLEAVNAVMSEAQAAGDYEGFRPHTTGSDKPGQVTHLPAVPRDTRALAQSAADTWRDSLTTPRQVPEERLITLECRQAAAWIARRIAGGLAPREVMVLARKRDRLSALEDELRVLGIAAQQPEKTDLGQAPEVQDLVALMDVLVSTSHDLSLARVLRSPVFCVQDQDLVVLAQRAREQMAQGQPRSWFELLQDDPEVGGFLPPGALQGIGATLARWKRWVDGLPPHDALDAIFHEGDVLARYAQATAPALRVPVLANLRALLGAALTVAGGRYLTPYAFVRAMRAGAARAPAASQAQAVQLLTVHGAKGLEAPLVLLLDTDSAAPRAQTMGVLVDWPGQSQAPRRFAFLASESRPPACCIEALTVEHQAREREELNALYVAMTRARRELVISSVEPRSASPGSWWRRVHPLCQRIDWGDLQAPEPLAQGAVDCWLPVVTANGRVHRGEDAGSVLPVPNEGHARFGQALHRLLECWPEGAWACPAALRQRVTREFRLTAGVFDEVAAMAGRILQGEGAWVWDRAHVDWAANEVQLHYEGELLRIDRLVRRREDAAWWVLDYKSASQPERDAPLLEQMRRYQRAVQAAHPGEAVRAAFLTGQGRWVGID